MAGFGVPVNDHQVYPVGNKLVLGLLRFLLEKLLSLFVRNMYQVLKEYVSMVM